MTILIFLGVVLATLIGNVVMIALETLMGQYIASIQVFNFGLIIFWVVITILIRAVVDVIEFIDR
jgi:hypothetical protein